MVDSRSTQTNEAARCAVLLPILSRIDGDVALIEAGASGGLTLYPDRYSYRYDVAGTEVELDPAEGRSEVVIPCIIDEKSVPTRLPNVLWRAGVDLNPIDVRDPSELSWLETLVWPEHDARRERLRAAATIAAASPPHLVRGDLLEEVPHLIDAAPADARIVVFHSAVLNYLARGSEARRERRVRSNLVIAIAEDEHRLVGMAWLVLFERVPNVDARVRVTGDIQSVFALPTHRRQGIGRALVAALISAADKMTLTRVTVSANEAAAHLYLDAGFTQEKNLLERRLYGETDR